MTYQYLVSTAFWVLQLPLLALDHTSQHCLKEVRCHSSSPSAEDIKLDFIQSFNDNDDDDDNERDVMI